MRGQKMNYTIVWIDMQGTLRTIQVTYSCMNALNDRLGRIPHQGRNLRVFKGDAKEMTLKEVIKFVVVKKETEE